MPRVPAPLGQVSQPHCPLLPCPGGSLILRLLLPGAGGTGSLSQPSLWGVFCSGMLNSCQKFALLVSPWGDVPPASTLLAWLSSPSQLHLSTWRAEPSAAFLIPLENEQTASRSSLALGHRKLQINPSATFTTVLFWPGTNSSQPSACVLLNLIILVDYYPTAGSKHLWGWSGSLVKQEPTPGSKTALKLEMLLRKSHKSNLPN